MLGHGVATRHSLGYRTAPELETLWTPFLDSKLPLILSIEDPLFAEIRSSPECTFETDR
jgi:hypothetical protein